jgi:hypothetical protein
MREPHVPHVLNCPECQVELCADPTCTAHRPDAWVTLHAETHHSALKALLLLHSCREA